MSFFLFPNFYARALARAIGHFAFVLPHILRAAWQGARLAYWTSLNEQFKAFEWDRGL